MVWKCYIYQRCQQPAVCGCEGVLHQWEGSWAARTNWEAIALVRAKYPRAEVIRVYPDHAFGAGTAKSARWDKDSQPIVECGLNTTKAE